MPVKAVQRESPFRHPYAVAYRSSIMALSRTARGVLFPGAFQERRLFKFCKCIRRTYAISCPVPHGQPDYRMIRGRAEAVQARRAARARLMEFVHPTLSRNCSRNRPRRWNRYPRSVRTPRSWKNPRNGSSHGCRPRACSGKTPLDSQVADEFVNMVMHNPMGRT